MRKILYTYNSLGTYQTGDDTSFAEADFLQITVEPHEFSIAVGGEVVRSTSCAGYVVTVSRDGAAVFLDSQNHVIGRADKGMAHYQKISLVWKQDSLTVQFGYTAVVDFYPNCDGEYDRYGEEWITQRWVTLNIPDKSISQG